MTLGEEGGYSDVDMESLPEVEETTAPKPPADLQNASDQLPPDFEDTTCTCMCKCGRKCMTLFDSADVIAFRLSVMELSRDQKDLVVLIQISAHSDNSMNTQCSRRANQKERERARMKYFFRGKGICREMFLYLHCISHNKLIALKKWFRDHGLTPVQRKSGGRAPRTNLLSPTDIRDAVTFITNYAEDHAVFLPGRIPGFKRSDLRLLPASATKASVHRLYEQAMKDKGARSMALSTFRAVWVKYQPRIMTCKPMTDLCWRCQKNTTRLFQLANQTESEKKEQLASHQKHLDCVIAERENYRQQTAASRVSITRDPAELGPHPPCSREGEMHYSFDFAQQVHFPSNPLQPGPLYFLTPRKCGIFGINCEGIPKQVNFLVDEGMAHSKGSIAVISYLHYFFRCFGLGEKVAHLHCDNCAGQNKNKFVLWYLAWRCIHKLHMEIDLNFMVAGHTKFAPDYGFGLLKKRYRASEVSTLQDIVDVVRSSSPSGLNVPVLVGDESGRQNVPTYPWQEFLSAHFKPIADVKKYHHFRFTSEEPGVVYCREFADDEEVRHQLLKPGARPPRMLPPSLPVPGLPQERQMYLYTKIRPFCRPESRDITCPPPPGIDVGEEMEAGLR
ncbi:uncharacterized protein [Diadema setosum]|uniref:uncharacterized protein n=2 Tax=Diadema setosum TaxID=31175 RepID=UPI003B3A4A60